MNAQINAKSMNNNQQLMKQIININRKSKKSIKYNANANGNQ